MADAGFDAPAEGGNDGAARPVVDGAAADQPRASPAGYAFGYFRGGEHDGLSLAWSRDGYRWTAVRNGSAVYNARVGNWKIFRDPCVFPAPDGTFHLVWTTGSSGFGYASSKNLLTWSEPEYVLVNRGILARGLKNVWAPEIFHDVARSRYMVIFASTLAEVRGDHEGWDHRHYFVTTTDFRTYSEPKKLHETGYTVIDGVIVEHLGKYHLVFKDERLGQRALRWSVADHPEGPWSTPSSRITAEWTEGPTILRVGQYFLLYYDEYTRGRYGALRSTDLRNWTNISSMIRMPARARHGSAFSVSEAILSRLMAAQ
jgi:beta-xylosidase